MNMNSSWSRRLVTLGIAVGLAATSIGFQTLAANAATATAVAITSVVDTSYTPASPVPVAKRSFKVTAVLRDASGVQVKQSGVSITLSATNAVGGTLAAVTGSSLTALTNTAGTATFTATYSTAQVGLILKATPASTKLTAGTSTVTVASSALTAAASPGTALSLGPIAIGTSTFSASLPNGASGTVAIYSEPNGTCPDGYGLAVTLSCSIATLSGTFKNAAGVKLYSNDKPAKMTTTCTLSNCPKTASGTQSSEFTTYKLQVALKDPKTGLYNAFATAPSCRDLTNTAQNGLTGAIVSTAAVAAGFCIDVYAISRDAAGTLSRPVLFVEDPRLTPISR